jgi:hypothetical protein
LPLLGLEERIIANALIDEGGKTNAIAVPLATQCFLRRPHRYICHLSSW